MDEEKLKISETEEITLLSPDDKSLSRKGKGGGLSVNRLKILAIVFFVLTFGGITLALYSSQKKEEKKADRSQDVITTGQAPEFLDNRMDSQSKKEEIEETQAATDIIQEIREKEEKRVYISPDEEQMVKKVRHKVKPRNNLLPTIVNREDNKAENESPIFANVTLPGYVKPIAQHEEEGQYDVLKQQIENSLVTEYQKQNMQKDKVAWIQERKSDFSGYLNSVYTEPFDLDKEIKAGTFIPIVMETGINSDLPGKVTAKTLLNIYDTNSGNNLLIPKGSTVIGDYNSEVSYGQNRVLVTFDRIIMQNNVSLNIKGMLGVDLTGMAGLKDKVFNHTDKIISTTLLSGAYDLGMNSLQTLLSSINGLAALADEEESDNIKEMIIQKILNRQPTLEIRKGIRGYILVDRDIILPIYEEEYL